MSDIDKQIAQKTAELKGYLNAGIQPSDVENLKQILGQVQSVNNNSLQVFIDGATDIDAVRQEINRAFDNFSKKVYGATA